MVIGNNIAGGMIVHSGPHPKPAYAGCGLSPQQGSKVKGVVKFIQQTNGKTKIYAELAGLTPGKHSIKIHEYRNVVNNVQVAGPIFNPLKKQNLGNEKNMREVGHLGFVTAGQDGTATFELEDNLIKVSGPQSIIGRSIFIDDD